MSSPDNADTTTPQQVIVDQELKEHKDHKEQPTVRLNGEVVELTKPLHAHTHTADNTDVSEAENGDESEDDDLAEELNPDEEYIDLTNRRLGKLPDLSHLTNCKEIVLRLNHLTNDSLPAIASLPHIKYIDLYENRLTYLSPGEEPFNTLKELEELDLSFNELRFTRGLHGMPKLKKLYLIENKITRIDPDDFNDMPELEMLELGSNRLRKIEHLDNIPTITQLFLGRNKITRIENLGALKNLRLLNLQSNRIVKIENLDELVNLEELYLSHNGISQIENLDKLVNLKTLDLAGNRLKVIKNIAHLTKLVDLWLNNNLIDSDEALEESLEEIAKLPALETLYLEQNPICTTIGQDEYRRTVLRALPRLQQLDADYVE